MASASVPKLDRELRLRLARRFGGAVDAWFDALPDVLTDLGERWSLEWGMLIQRGSMSVVIRCRTAEGRQAVLKTSPERTRIAYEAAALASWSTPHVPAVLAVDESAGALLIEAIEPGTSLAEAAAYPAVERVAALLTSLHEDGVPDPRYRPVADHIAYLFDAGLKNYERRPDLAEVVPPELYAHGRRLAMRLAADAGPTVLLHGDLTPANVLDGGAARGLVAIDPAPCLGDPAFDAVDLVLWQAADVEAIALRAEQLAPAVGGGAGRLLDWCSAFAGMVALELAEAPGGPGEQVEHLLALGSRA
ncbi:MAG TPA: aminoglycoside phosphotransferase family protein [Gaiellaceae bacterium]|nr:aminoglycoside phosphotransferase family protein [Gaiellaceae bacterium]